MSARELLINTKALINERDKWTQFTSARRADGFPVAVHDILDDAISHAR